MLQLNIPRPCHEDWNKMTPGGDGRFCGACATTVVDFTGMTDAEVQNYFLKRRGEKLCGRFTNAQIHRIRIDLPERIFQMPLPLWKRFLAACLVAFSMTLFSCETRVTGDTVIRLETTKGVSKKVMLDTLKPVPPADTSLLMPPPPPPLTREPINVEWVQGTTSIGVTIPEPEPPLMGVPELPVEPDPVPQPVKDSACKQPFGDTLKKTIDGKPVPPNVNDSTVVF